MINILKKIISLITIQLNLFYLMNIIWKNIKYLKLSKLMITLLTYFFKKYLLIVQNKKARELN